MPLGGASRIEGQDERALKLVIEGGREASSPDSR